MTHAAPASHSTAPSQPAVIVRLADPAAALAWLSARAAPGAPLRTDSRRVVPGDVFIAWPGLANDARRFVATALQAGAAACLVDAEGVDDFLSVWAQQPVATAGCAPAIAVLPGLKAAAGAIADAWLGQPGARLEVVASTGTNGKTSTSWWMAQALSLAGRRCGVIGTLGAGDPPTRLNPQGSVAATGFTTPDPVTLHGALATFAADGHAAVALEASSIGLVEQRLNAVPIKVALFTNFTPDHLDYHGDMASYWAAKRMLFDWPGLQAAVVNLDDPQGAALAEELAAQAGGVEASALAELATLDGVDPTLSGALALWTYSREHAAARLFAQDLHYTARGLAFTLVETDAAGRRHSAAVATGLIGDYNASNVLAVLGGLRALGLPLAQAAALAADFTPVPGRMQRVEPPAAAVPLPEVVVDYAHTPDALEQALRALRPLANARGGSLLCVFGCGGNRDAGKRPVMGEIAARLADRVLVTSDNPRHEDPQAIVAQILAGIPPAGAGVVQAEVDRAVAIARAIAQAAPADVVLLAGKGHETEQEIAGVKRHFSDVEQARAALAARLSVVVADAALASDAVTLPSSLQLFTLGRAQALLRSRGVAAALRGDATTPIDRVHSDTRSLRAGDLFVALRGERHDAHAFLAQAQSAGASAALVERGLADGAAASTEGAVALPGLVVPDSLVGLQQLAAAWRAEQVLPLIAVTGSNGKTTVTQMIAAILRAWLGEAAHATAGNLNNHIGVPLTLLALRPGHCGAVVELGMNHPGEIAELAALARPTVALVNNAQREHQEFMGTIDAVAAENGSVISALPAGGVAVFPAGDSYSALWAGLAGARRVLRFHLDDDSAAVAEAGCEAGREATAAIAAEVRGQAVWQLDHWQLALHTPAGSAELALHIAGRHNARNALAAAACALAAGCPLADVVAGLQGFRPVNGRSQVERLALPTGAITLVNDSYNANPDSVRAAIDLLAELPAPRWLLLGDMGEVGEQGPEFHQEVGAYARERGIDALWTAGTLAAHAAQACGAAATHHADTTALVAALGSQPWPAAASVLVKGSRFMKMEQALAVLRTAAVTSAAPARDLASSNNNITTGGPVHAA
jgi:murE/murF fusion protein